ncbi:uracil-DNA glycosylase [Pantoea sp. Mhis]|uniref:uracil-DNA glycosylase n=1 Tax=Pantoea sp. Mhis TaxID=2576759 RepID=UPI00135B2AC0|nr:uracil-DNA glycosylase [Pantoea sp. Mhis]MXP56613.1 uracil-DNA glycosylase [Pantoea sp. Mhis]
MTKNITWNDVLTEEKKKLYFINILKSVSNDRASGIVVYPSEKDVFNAFRLTELFNVKVVILGQDPYYKANQAHGLAFSVLPNIPIPPSLINIYKELEQDIPNFILPQHGFLKSWATQGVFLLNSILTVKAGKPHSHAHLGWDIFTDKVISIINQYCKNIIFLFWGVRSQQKINIIDRNRHFILKTSHPSPLSAHRGFFGCKHFSQTNILLCQKQKKPIDWSSISKYKPIA